MTVMVVLSSTFYLALNGRHASCFVPKTPAPRIILAQYISQGTTWCSSMTQCNARPWKDIKNSRIVQYNETNSMAQKSKAIQLIGTTNQLVRLVR